MDQPTKCRCYRKASFSPYNIAYFPYFIRKMADSRKHLTTEGVLKFFNGDESSNESDSEQEESFSEYTGTVLPECESDGSFPTRYRAEAIHLGTISWSW